MAAADDIAQIVIRQTANAIAISAAAGITKAVKQTVGRELPTVVRALGEALDRRLLPDSLLKDTNQKIANAAHSAVKSSFESRLPRRGASGGDLSGTLKSALNSGSMTAATTDRVISFVNPSTLDSSARHWYRVNYGALGPAYTKPGGHRPEVFTITLQNRPFARLADTHAPANRSYLPRVWFFDGPRFIASRGPSRVIGPGGYTTARGRRLGGSRPARFLDVGYRVVAEQFPIRYDQMFRTWVEQTGNRAKLASKNINVVVDLRSESYGFEVKSNQAG